MFNDLKFVLTIAAASLLLAGCQSVPVDANQTGELVVSRGVAEYFEDEETDQVVAGQGNDIKCIRERRVGTHMVTRICRTKSEWAAMYRQTQDVHRRRMTGACGSGAPGICSEGRGL
ncbi:MAG: hypothetical protein AAGA23_22400 [Pseudomonadota bacterium]